MYPSFADHAIYQENEYIVYGFAFTFWNWSHANRMQSAFSFELRQHGHFMNTVKITHKRKKASYDGYDLPKLTSLRAAV